MTSPSLTSAEASSSSFLAAYARVLVDAIGNDFDDNYDARRFGPEISGPKRRPMRKFLHRMLLQAGLVTSGSVESAILSGLNSLEPHLRSIDWLYARLEDELSRDTLVKVMAYRALGHRKVKLPLNNAASAAALEKIERLAEAAESIEFGFMNWRLAKLDLSTLGYPITLFARSAGVFTQFAIQQYRYCTSEAVIQAEPDETVLDGGGCTGDTALYFAHRTGPSGIVYSSEFLAENLAVFRRNLALNPELADRIRVVERPLWSLSNEDLFVEAAGPATRVLTSSDNPDARRIFTLAIDDLVRDENIERVDMIKMDIEGAELAALTGAKETLKKFRPKLAIAVYHRLEDFWTIPQFIDGLALGYKYFLAHFTIHSEETVLFASVNPFV